MQYRVLSGLTSQWFHF